MRDNFFSFNAEKNHKLNFFIKVDHLKLHRMFKYEWKKGVKLSNLSALTGMLTY